MSDSVETWGEEVSAYLRERLAQLEHLAQLERIREESAARNSQMQNRYNEWLSNLRVGENPRREAPPCDCGAEKSGTTHAHWCSRMNDLKE